VTRLYGRPTALCDYSALRPALIQKVEAKAASQGFDLLYRPSADPLQFRLTALFRVDLGNYGKGVLAEHGLSVRDPTADRRVVEYCLSVPPEEFVRGGVTRSLARRAFADRLPGSVIHSTLRGYQSADWYEAIEGNLDMLRQEVEAIGRCGPAAEVMDMNWLDGTLSTWPATGWESEAVRLRYRHGLLRTIQTGHFMRKVAGSN
jgi:asparagine synthase (glutamine-hydrolysing)